MNHSVLILTGRAFQIFDPSNLRLLVTNVTLFLLGIFKFNLYQLQVTRFLSFFSNIFKCFVYFSVKESQYDDIAFT